MVDWKEMIKSFTLGVIGSLISAISVAPIVVALFFSVYLEISVDYGSFAFVLIMVFLGVGILLASFGYREVKSSFGLFSGTTSFVFAIISSVFIFLTIVVDLITPEYMILIYPTPLIYRINSWVNLLNGLFFGLTQVVWGVTHFKLFNFCKRPNLCLIAFGFFVVSGVLFLILIGFGYVFSFMGLLFASIVFLNLGSDVKERPESKINEDLQKEG